MSAPIDPVGTNKQLAELERYLQALGSVVVCFSGGVDSALVLAAAARALGSKVVALTAVSASLAETERAEAVELARSLGVDHVLRESGEIEQADYATNPPDRCFHCKSELYRLAHALRAERGFAAVVNGANADDVGDYRPGQRAGERAGVRSPLLELGLTKSDVRALARQVGLRVWDKPAAACLASRVPYGTRITGELLGQIAAAERGIKAHGFQQVRVRVHGDLARIELDPASIERAVAPPMRAALVDAVARAGFRYVSLDLTGYRQGSHNEALDRPKPDARGT
jgi:uncharacterized protein